MIEDQIGNAGRQGSTYMRNKYEVMEQCGKNSTDGKNKGKKMSKDFQFKNKWLEYISSLFIKHLLRFLYTKTWGNKDKYETCLVTKEFILNI